MTIQIAFACLGYRPATIFGKVCGIRTFYAVTGCRFRGKGVKQFGFGICRVTVFSESYLSAGRKAADNAL